MNERAHATGWPGTTIRVQPSAVFSRPSHSLVMALP